MSQTASETFVTKLCHNIFFQPWTYPNPFYVEGKGQKQELTDVLVVCDNSIILFSVKEITFNQGEDLKTAWSRWERKAIKASIRQLFGAKNTLIRKDKIYKDRLCKDKILLDYDKIDQMQFHLVCVTLGAYEFCKNYYGMGSRGSLPFLTSKSASRDISDIAENDPFRLFAEFPISIRDYEPEKDFVHVIDSKTLELVLNELDTITDFTRYLSYKSSYIRKRPFVMYTGEEDFLVQYINRSIFENDSITVNQNCVFLEEWNVFKKSKEYINYKKHKIPSYFWDDIIQNMMAMSQTGISATYGDYEKIFRCMALEDRNSRIGYANTLKDFYDTTYKYANIENFYMRTRVCFSGNKERCYLFLQYNEPDNTRKLSAKEFQDSVADYLCMLLRCFYAKIYDEIKSVRYNDFIGIFYKFGINNELPSYYLYLNTKEWTNEQQDEYMNIKKKLSLYRTPFPPDIEKGLTYTGE